MPPPFRLYFEREYQKAFLMLSNADQGRVRRAEQRLAENPRHPSLNTHKFRGAEGKYRQISGGQLFIAYASQGRGALRIVFEFGPQPGEIALHTCGPHDRAERRR